MLQARVLKSPHSHAGVKMIHTKREEELGATMVTFEEVPDVRFGSQLVSARNELSYK